MNIINKLIKTVIVISTYLPRYIIFFKQQFIKYIMPFKICAVYKKQILYYLHIEE